jgi:hypothetical protein
LDAGLPVRQPKLPRAGDRRFLPALPGAVEAVLSVSAALHEAKVSEAFRLEKMNPLIEVNKKTKRKTLSSRENGERRER